jgi:predicted porin
MSTATTTAAAATTTAAAAATTAAAAASAASATVCNYDPNSNDYSYNNEDELSRFWSGSPQCCC